LKDQDSEPAGLISEIALDEMGHFGLVCNLLRATGQQPRIFAGYDEIIYPGPLPGGVRPKCDPKFFPCDPQFEVVLGFNDFRSFAKISMQIEYPEDPAPRPLIATEGETFPSIGEFYNAVLKAFQVNDGQIHYSAEKQLTSAYPEVFVIDGLANANKAISQIQKQGEGSSRFPYVDPNGIKLAHFYTFGEIYFGKKYVFDPIKQTGDWTGTPVGPVSPADVFPMTPVPHGGYGRDVPPEVADCDNTFTQMLQQLDAAWANGEATALRNAIRSMRALRTKAIALLQKQIPRREGGIYGPQFRKSVA
jgi:hypothetical protein